MVNVMSKHEVSDKVLEDVAKLVKSVDDLCTAVISGKSGQMQLALNVARILSELKRGELNTNVHR